MARKKGNPGDTAPSDNLDLADPVEAVPPQETAPPEEPNRAGTFDKLSMAKQRLGRMEETNRMCFKFRNDLATIESELVRAGYSDAEVEHIMEPKGAKSIPGFGFSELNRQRQYVNFLTEKRAPQPDGGFAAREEQRRESAGELELS